MTIVFKSDGSTVLDGVDSEAFREFQATSVRYETAKAELERAMAESRAAGDACRQAERYLEQVGEARRLAREKLLARPQFQPEKP